MPDLVNTALISAGSAFVGGLISVFLTPKLQHYFWTLQRRAELRLSVINDINRLLAEFTVNYSPTWQPDRIFLASLISIVSQVKDLFPHSYQTFLRVQSAVSENLHQPGTIAAFLVARDAALRALYKEVGVL